MKNKIGHCFLHANSSSYSTCAICDEEICETCTSETDSLNFCPEHLVLYKKCEWVAISNQLTTANSPEAGIYIYQFKESIWSTGNTPSFIVTSYDIDEDSQVIQSYVKLFVLIDDEKKLKKNLNKNANYSFKV